MKNKFVRYFVVIIVSCVLSLSVLGCSKPATSTNDFVENTTESESVTSGNKIDNNSDRTIQDAETDVVAIVNGEEIKIDDISYYIFNNATIQMYTADSTTTQDITDFDWSKTDSDGNVLKDVVVKRAINEAISDAVFRQKAVESGYDMNNANTEASELVSNAIEKKGKENFLYSANSIGISNADSYRKIYADITVFEDVAREILSKPEKYVSDINILSDYTGNRGATVQHVLIMNNTDKGDSLEIINKVLDKAKSGDDFVQLMNQYNEDNGEEEVGYTFAEGEMLSSFEIAAFNLKINEISDVVQSDYGYHVIKRNAGAYELQNYWTSLSSIEVAENIDEIIDFDAVMQNIKEANLKITQEGN